MRNRPIDDPEPALAAAKDPHPSPGRGTTLESELIDAGVPLGRLAAVKTVLYSEAIRLTGEAFRRLLKSMDRSPAAVALERAICGDGGQSLSKAAEECGTSPQALHVAQTRIAKRIVRAQTSG
jgi:hypothetical protein